MLPLGDPQCSPVWTAGGSRMPTRGLHMCIPCSKAVVQQLEIGERASFTLSRKALEGWEVCDTTCQGERLLAAGSGLQPGKPCSR